MKSVRQNNSDNWETPQLFYNKLNDKYNFDFDPCPINSEKDGLLMEWGNRNFINPPYSRKLKESFVHKALEQSIKGKTCVLLLPVSTSTKLFHDVILPNAKLIEFVRGRIGFIGINSNNKKTNGTEKPMHDSMIVVFEGRN